MSELSDDLLAELMATFYVEARDRLDAASRQLLILEETSDPVPRADLVAEIFREVHSLKGASAAVGLEGIRDLSHSLETLFERAREGETLDPSAFDVVYEALDAIESLVGDAASGEASGLDTTQIIARLENAAGDLGTGSDTGGAESRLRPRRLDEQTSAPTTPVPAVAAAVEGAVRPADDTIRVSTAKLDALMAQVGELLVTTIGTERRLADAARLVELSGRADAAWREARTIYRRLLSDLTGPGQASMGELSSLLDFVQHSDELGQQISRGASDLERKLAADGRRLAQIVSELQDDVRRTRMLPVSTLFSALPRLLRDVAREVGKESVLMVEGGETEVDRSVLEQLRAPMNHLLRNAVDHGLETPEVRRASGKPASGTITVFAHQRGDSLVVEIADDGAGIDAGVVRASAVKRGLVTEAEAESMGDAGALDLIFRSGVSTSPMITDLSGRGVGLDVVRDAIERMHGILEVHTELGAGTTFVLNVPLAVATIQCLLVRSGEANFAIPATNVVRVLRLDPGRIGHADGRETIVVDGRPVPVTHLDEVLGLPRPSDPEPTAKLPVIVLGSVDKRVALIARGLLGAQEVVIKGLPPPLVRVRNIAGAGIMGTGEIVLVLNNGDLTRSADGANVQTDMATPREEAHTGASVVLVADDSIVTRTLEKNILESAGFRVRVAADGLEAWDVLQSEGVHLLVADVEMPRLDGFDLTERVRCDRRLRDLPVVLVTSMDSHEHRERGVAVGADAHIIKQSFNQEVLLDTIRRLI
jgi:two-component system chemotaxis sensor kinase CheA